MSEEEINLSKQEMQKVDQKTKEEVEKEEKSQKDEDHRHPLSFTGDAREYFNIWIVNIALTILTLGIFSAWAKVRKKRYFYGNTYADGHGEQSEGR